MSYTDSSSFQASPSQRREQERPVSASYPSSTLASSATAPALTDRHSAYAPPIAIGNASLMSNSPGAEQSYRTAHPSGRAATGGQTHSHRPVSAMPAPPSQSQRANMAQVGNADDVLSTMSGGYNDRRASAHPTLPTSSQTVQGLAQIAISPSIDANLASNAISSGIPITSQAAMQYFAAHPRRQQVHFGNYLLLQTLGEGEFGKVKLGVHKEWGEEVAVKLIKREKVGGDKMRLDISPPGVPPKDPAKMTKVEREIQVLKDMRHPNIVRLYEVIESDRYIGIVLEYASGGELFDHILAHKYLKDRDACRLFAQLISGVNYLHQKKVVHRDLKLENLLLDRNRNVIITDFGFANNFGDRQDDLMATSCGSPCYAAPELVVQDGLYNGSAVDVWSCGVILYAMLAGYLPFDDDPANPEGDNINLLYKYIMATPLSFPEYITAEPRDLLSKMLVPDPAHRIDLRGVMAHNWLTPYRELFKFTVDELERAAVEQQTKKRQVYMQQMVLQFQMRERQKQEAANAAAVQRSEAGNRSAVGGPAAFPSSSTSMASGLTPQTVKAARHQSATASTPQYETRTARTNMDPPATVPSKSQATAMPLADSTNRVHDAVVAQGDARGEPRARRDDREVVETLQDDYDEQYKKGPAASKPQRHTVQLEYDGGAAAAAKREASYSTNRSTSSTKPATDAVAPTQTAVSSGVVSTPAQQENPAASVAAVPVLVPEAEAITAEKTTSKASNASLPPSSEQPSSTTARHEKPADRQPSSSHQEITHSAPESSIDPVFSAPAARRQSSSRAGSTAPSASASASLLAHQQRDEASDVPSSMPAQSQESSTDTAATRRSKRHSVTAATMPPTAASNAQRANSTRRHTRGASTEKSFLTRLLSGNNTPTTGSSEAEPRLSNASRPTSPTVHAINADRSTQGSNLGRSGSNRRKAMSLVIGGSKTGGDAASKDRERANAVVRDSAKTGRQEPPKTASGAQGPFASTDASHRPAAPSRQSSRPLTQQGPPPSTSSRTGLSRGPGKERNDYTFERKNNDSSSTVGPSSSAAKKVMDWFRRKSLGKGASPAEQPPLPSFDSEKRRMDSTTTGTTASTPKARPATASAVNANTAPKLTVTEADGEETGVPVTVAPPFTPSEGGPSSRSTSGAYSNGSHSSAATGITSATESSYVNVNGAMLPPSASSSKTKAPPTSTPTQQTTPRPSYSAPAASSATAQAFNENLLRYHVGAVDQSALTSRPPPEVFAEVIRALFEMGIEAKRETEEEFKVECVRRRKPTKSLIGATQGLGTSLRSSVFPPTQADYERSSNGLARSPTLSALGSPTANNNVALGSPTMSPSQSSLRNFLRRGSQTASPSSNIIALPEPLSSTAMEQSPSQQSNNSTTQRNSLLGLPPTLYGEARLDGGQEVRFSVEVTRIKNLAGLYSLDVRRLRGPLTSYKFLYHNVLKRVTDPNIDQ